MSPEVREAMREQARRDHKPDAERTAALIRMIRLLHEGEREALKAA